MCFIFTRILTSDMMALCGVSYLLGFSPLTWCHCVVPIVGLDHSVTTQSWPADGQGLSYMTSRATQGHSMCPQGPEVKPFTSANKSILYTQTRVVMEKDTMTCTWDLLYYVLIHKIKLNMGIFALQIQITVLVSAPSISFTCNAIWGDYFIIWF